MSDVSAISLIAKINEQPGVIRKPIYCSTCGYASSKCQGHIGEMLPKYKN